jgi:hypothetical protein
MEADPIERLNYYQFQYLAADDLRDQQAYHRDMRRRHNLGPHSWGIVSGCTIVETAREGDPPFVDVYVLPGVIVDGFGREIVLLEPTRVDPELFAAYATDRHLELWIRYDEVAARTATGGFAPCTDAESYSRTMESHRFLVGTLTPARDQLVVGGDTAALAAAATSGDPIEPEDGSISYRYSSALSIGTARCANSVPRRQASSSRGDAMPVSSAAHCSPKALCCASGHAPKRSIRMPSTLLRSRAA